MASLTVELGPVVLTVASDAGPRVLAYARAGRPSVFADLPDATVDDPAVGRYRLLGGHRLWRAPEVPAITYHPDDHGVRVTTSEDRVELIGAPDGDGVVKHVTVHQHGSVTVVDHALEHRGEVSVRTAAWAITQLATGGTAILPQPVGDPRGRLPDRHLVLWPYTDLGAPEVRFVGDTIRVDGSTSTTASKVGYANRRGWLAYHLDDQLFVKWGPEHADADEHVDFGSTAEFYRNQDFVELETVGPLVTLGVGEVVRHREVWQLFDADAGSLDDVLASLPVRPAEMTT